jgi:hypothetical protein
MKEESTKPKEQTVQPAVDIEKLKKAQEIKQKQVDEKQLIRK